ncbi:MAG: fumarate hydratase [Eubacteriales bacterium]
MRTIDASLVSDTVKALLIEANRRLPSDVERCIRASAALEANPVGKEVLTLLCQNLEAATAHCLPICQDTGMAVVFAELGSEVHIEGADLSTAIQAGVARAYTEGKLRCSIVRDPLYTRENTGDNTPAVIHLRAIPGDKLRLRCLPKGFGSENMSRLKMMTPSASEADVVDFVVDCVRSAGAQPCPPLFVGVGIGGDFETAPLLAKEALLREVGQPHPDERYRLLEEKLMASLNALDIGPQGFGGSTTVFAVKVNHAPTHIAGLPVAVNICCHVMRHAEAVI